MSIFNEDVNWWGRAKDLDMKIFLSAAALTVCFASVAAAQTLTGAERRGIAGAVVSQDPYGSSALSEGFMIGSGGIPPRVAAGMAGPAYVVVAPKRHWKKRHR